MKFFYKIKWIYELIICSTSQYVTIYLLPFYLFLQPGHTCLSLSRSPSSLCDISEKEQKQNWQYIFNLLVSYDLQLGQLCFLFIHALMHFGWKACWQFNRMEVPLSRQILHISFNLSLPLP